MPRSPTRSNQGQAENGAAEEALSVGRSSTVRKALSDVRSSVVDGTISRNEAAEQVVAMVESFGLQPVEQVEPLTEITEEDLGVVCWMVVLGPNDV